MKILGPTFSPPTVTRPATAAPQPAAGPVDAVELSSLGSVTAQRDELKTVVQAAAAGKPFPHQSYLITGDSGTGTTTLATALAKDLGRYGITTFQTSGGELIQRGHQGLTELFAQARQTAAQCPAQTAVIFMDDVDSAFLPRNTNQPESHQLLGVFLEEAANLKKEDGTQILLLGTSSRPDTMDWNARDSFKRNLNLQIPGNAEERLAVLQSQLRSKGLTVGDSAALRELADSARGASPNKLSGILDNARNASGHSQLSGTDLRLARLEHTYGPAVVKTIPDWSFRLTASHEMGHAVIRHFFEAMARPDEVPLAIDLISLIPRQGTEAAVELKYNGNPTKTLEYYVAEVTSNYAGRAAEMLFGDGHLSAGAGNDLEFVSRAVKEAVMEQGMGATLGALRPDSTGLSQAYQARAQADMDRMLTTCEHLALTITKFYGPIIQSVVEEFVARRQDPASLIMTGNEFRQRLADWEGADPERGRQLTSLRGYVRQKVEALRPATLQAWDPATGTLTPVSRSA